MLEHVRQHATLLRPAHSPVVPGRALPPPAEGPTRPNQPSDEIDQTLADSFPASDPPSWTLGIARVAPVREPAESGRLRASPPRASSSDDAGASSAGLGTEGTRTSARTTGRGARIGFWRGVRSVLGAMGLVLVLPFVLLLLGLPIALLVRVLVDAVSLALSLGGAR